MNQQAAIDFAHIDRLVRALVTPRRTDLNHFEHCLGVRLSKDLEVGNWVHYLHVPSGKVIERIAVAQSVDSTCTRLTVTFAQGLGPVKDEALLATYGKALSVQAAPRVPPEGVMIWGYNLDLALVKFSFSSLSGRLHTLNIEWPF